MSERTETRSAKSPRFRRLIQAPQTVSEAGADPPRTLSPPRLALGILATGLWFGLAFGMVEAGILSVWNLWYSTYLIGILQLSPHFPWLLPVGEVLLFGIAAALLSVLAVVKCSKKVYTLAVGVFLTLGTFSLLSLNHGLYEIASLTLAAGVGIFLAPLLTRSPRDLARVMGLSAPLMLGGLGYQAATLYDQEVLGEQRLVDALPPADPKAPNVLLIVLDTVSAEHTSLNGYHKPTTPHLDEMAKHGVSFDMARSPAPWTLPAHSSLMTGYWPNELHVGRPDIPLDNTYPTLAEFFSKQGYYTSGFVGNTFYCNTWFGLARGFQHYEDYYEQGQGYSLGSAVRSSELGRRISWHLFGTAYNARKNQVNPPKDARKINLDFAHWLRHHRDRPFFTFLNYNDAHDPYQVPPGFATHLGRVAGSPEEQTAFVARWSDERARYFDDLSVIPDPSDVELARDAYDDCIRALDSRLGQLFDSLEKNGILQNTVVVVTADHGEEFGGHNLFMHGASMYRPELHVPLLVYAPSRAPEGVRIKTPVSTRNIAMTVTDLAGFADERPFPGQSLVDYWDPSRTVPGQCDDGVVSISQALGESLPEPNPNMPPARVGALTSLIVENWVYIRDDFGYEELYELWADPGEVNNLVEHPDLAPILQRCRNAWKAVWSWPGVRPIYPVSTVPPKGKWRPGPESKSEDPRESSRTSED